MSFRFRIMYRNCLCSNYKWWYQKEVNHNHKMGMCEYTGATDAAALGSGMGKATEFTADFWIKRSCKRIGMQTTWTLQPINPTIVNNRTCLTIKLEYGKASSYLLQNNREYNIKGDGCFPNSHFLLRHIL